MKNFVKIVIILGVVKLFVGLSFASDIPCDYMIDNLDLSVRTYNVENLTRNFCKQISNSSCVHDGDIFDANQSIFMTILCDNVGAGQYFTGDRTLLLKTGFTQFDIYRYFDGSDVNHCNYKDTILNDCDFSKQLPKIFDQIINDYFNIKQADLYGVDSLSGSEEVLSNQFSKANFVGLELCDPNSEYYKKTCTNLKSYMKGAKNLLKNTKVINFEKLIEQEVDCDKDWNQNILYCSLVGEEIASNRVFLSAIYNEYLWYNLFATYYSYELSNDYRYGESITDDKQTKKSLNLEKVYSFNEQIYRTRSSISMAMRSLSEISSSFAIHIGFLMYQEDAKMFMKQISKLYAPIRTLYDKLRNVQKAE